MEIKRIVNTIFNSNSFILSEEGRAIIIDIGDFSPLKDYTEAKRLEVSALFLTHTHYDHIYGIREFMNCYPNCPIYTSEFGKEALKMPNWNFSRYHEDEIQIESELIRILDNGARIEVAEGVTLETLATPGHDPSSLSFRIGNLLFTGDSYIPGVKVIANFPKSNKEEAQYWYEKLEEMGGGMNIYPGHGNPIERKFQINHI